MSHNAKTMNGQDIEGAETIQGDLVITGNEHVNGNTLVDGNEHVIGNLVVDGTISGGVIGGGSVTSVAMTVPTFLSVTGTPITTTGTLAVTLSGTALPVLNGGTGTTTSTGTGSVVLNTAPSVTSMGFTGATSGTVNLTPQAIAGTYNFNLPITAGSSGQLLTSAGGVNAPMTWSAPNTNTGTVTSVAMTVPTFLSVSGTPVTSTGTLAVTLSGTALPVVNGGTGTTTSTGTGNTVLSASPTFTGTVTAATINATVSQTTGSGAINLVNNAAADGPYLWTALAPNLPTTKNMYWNFGVAQSTNNSFVNWFNYAGAGSTSNSLNWGPWNNGNTLSFLANGQLRAPSLSTNSGTDVFTYSSGTFSPTIIGGTTAGTYTYSPTPVGTYQLMGKMCFITVNIFWTVTGAGSGDFVVAGLPFNASGTTGVESVMATITDNITFPSGTNKIVMFANPSTTQALFQCSGNNVASTRLQIVTSGSGSVIASGWYITT